LRTKNEASLIVNSHSNGGSFVVVLLWVFSLPPAVATGLAAPAAAPGAPVTYKRAEAAGGDLEN
jgi:hypothetical protein